MKVFNNYAHYYNLLYKDKDYKSEVDYIDKLIHKYKPDTESILNLGCGTGNHDFYFVKKGYNVYGIDISEEMLDQARAKIKKLKYLKSNLNFSKADVRSVRLKEKFNTVVSLFHVASYMNTNNDILDYLKTAHFHLKENGIFIFDFWYGPAVLANMPSVRIKRLEDENIKVIRATEPVLHPNENIVDVKYEVVIEEKKTKKITRVEEVHKMRYFFKPEVEFMLLKTGFELLYAKEWMTEKPIGFDTWGVCFVATAR